MASPQTDWRPEDDVVIVDAPPRLSPASRSSAAGGPRAGDTATVRVTGRVLARVDSRGLMSLPSAAGAAALDVTYHLVLSKNLQWRIDAIPEGAGLVLTDEQFRSSFRSVSLYFADATGHWLVPDLRWFPELDTIDPAPTAMLVVSALLQGPAPWLGQPGPRAAVTTGAVSRTELTPVGGVRIEGDVVHVDLDNAIRAASPEQRAPAARAAAGHDARLRRCRRRGPDGRADGARRSPVGPRALVAAGVSGSAQLGRRDAADQGRRPAGLRLGPRAAVSDDEDRPGELDTSQRTPTCRERKDLAGFGRRGGPAHGGRRRPARRGGAAGRRRRRGRAGVRLARPGPGAGPQRRRDGPAEHRRQWLDLVRHAERAGARGRTSASGSVRSGRPGSPARRSWPFGSARRGPAPCSWSSAAGRRRPGSPAWPARRTAARRVLAGPPAAGRARSHPRRRRRLVGRRRRRRARRPGGSAPVRPAGAGRGRRPGNPSSAGRVPAGRDGLAVGVVRRRLRQDGGAGQLRQRRRGVEEAARRAGPHAAGLRRSSTARAGSSRCPQARRQAWCGRRDRGQPAGVNVTATTRRLCARSAVRLRRCSRWRCRWSAPGAARRTPAVPPCARELAVPPVPVAVALPVPAWSCAPYAGAAARCVVAWKDRGRPRPDGRARRRAVARGRRCRCGRAPGPGPSWSCSSRALLGRRPARPRRGRRRPRWRVRRATDLRRRGLAVAGPAGVAPASPVADQAGLGAAARRANLSGALGVRRPSRLRIPGAVVVLVDDVVTTGATRRRGLRRARERAYRWSAVATACWTPRRRRLP